MAFKIDPARFKLVAIARIRSAFGAIPRAWLRAPLSRGIAAAALLAAIGYGWLAFEATDTLRTLEARTPPVEVAIEAASPAAPNPAAVPPQEAADAPAAVGGSIPGLVEQTPAGPLPRIGSDGTQPWRAYAAPSDSAGDRPRIAVLVVGLGLSTAMDERAIRTLPGAVSLGIMAFADGIGPLIGEARARGHEIVLNAPMEPDQYPADDPGPQTLLVKASATENVTRLQWNLARGGGYIGIAPTMGSRFTASPEPLQPVLAELSRRGLLYVDTGSATFGAAPALARASGVPIAIADRSIDRVPNRAAIDRELADLEAIAKRKGSALGVATLYPVTFDRLAAWISTLDTKGIALVPVSAVAQAPAAAPRAGVNRPGG